LNSFLEPLMLTWSAWLGSKKRDNICTGESDRGLYHNYADSD
jgi:hypothetical protein